MATLRSNSGDKEFVIKLGAPVEYAHDLGFDSAICISGNCWNSDHTFPFSATVEGLWLRASDLTELRDHIARWIALPLKELIAGNLDGEFNLTRLPSQQVCVRFGERKDVIRSSDHPVLTINFSAGTLRGEFNFTTDQSCLSLFAGELSVELSRSK